MKKVCGFGEVRDGKLILRNKETFDAQLSQIVGKVDVTVEKTRSRRSLNQNAYYWAVVIPLLSDYTGYEHEEMHDILKAKFNSTMYDDGTEEVFVSRSTAKMSTLDFEAYLDKIKRWASQQLSVVIPDPNEAQENGTFE